MLSVGIGKCEIGDSRGSRWIRDALEDVGSFLQMRARPLGRAQESLEVCRGWLVGISFSVERESDDLDAAPPREGRDSDEVPDKRHGARRQKIVHFSGLLCGGHFCLYKVFAADSRCRHSVLLASS